MVSAEARGSDEGQEDRRWIVAVAAGEREALGRLYDRHASAMLGLACRILKTRRDAEDLLHDVFLEVWKKAGAFDASRGSVRGWLLMRTRCRAIDRVRALEVAHRHGLAAPESLAPPPEPPDPTAAPDSTRARRALQALSKEQRTVVELAYFEGLSCREIVERCEIPVGTVKSRLFAAMARLRRELGVSGGCPR